jgi:probable rRNA maturation factor
VDVFLANEQELPVDGDRLTALARHTLEVEEVDEDAELSILLVEPDHIRRLNARYAGNDYATDVLAFPMNEDDESEELLGDVLICPHIAGEDARRMGHSLSEELDVLLVHGLLHLLGYDHHDAQEKAEMEARLREVLATFKAPEDG